MVPTLLPATLTRKAEGLARPIGPHLQVEYPIASAWEEGQLLGGYIDLVGATEGLLRLIDFKTDAPPTVSVEQTYPEYAAQVRAYGRLLEAGLLEDRRLGCGLPVTADGGIRWIGLKGEKQLFSAIVSSDLRRQSHFSVVF